MVYFVQFVIVLQLIFVIHVINAQGSGKASGKAGACTPENCKLPDCSCSGTDIPGGLTAKDVPQMVMITFDDAVTSGNFQYYKQLFNDGTKARKNPNGMYLSP